MDIERDVKDFHNRFGHPAPEEVDRRPMKELIDFRMELIHEEFNELITAESLADMTAEAIDLVYVTVGLLVSLGIPMAPFWDAIHSANMTKKRDPMGGKPIKPHGWQEANIKEILYRLGK